MSISLKSLQTGFQTLTDRTLTEYLQTVIGTGPNGLTEVYRVRYVLYRLISDPGKPLSPDLVAKSAITVGSIPLLSFSLRKVSSTDGYLMTDEYGLVHWLIYLFRKWPEPSTMATAVALISLKGAKTSSPAYGTSVSNNRFALKVKSENVPNLTISVKELLYQEKPNDRLTEMPDNIQSQLLELFNPEDIPLLGIYLDDPKFTSYNPNDLGQVELMILLHSQSILSTLPVSSLDLALEAIEPVGFKVGVQPGLINYFLVNKVVVSCIQAADLPIVLDGLIQILKVIIQVGHDLDSYQVRALERSLPSPAYRQVIDFLSVPSWRRVCSSSEKLTPEVLDLARSLSIDYTQDKAQVCRQLEIGSQMDPVRLNSQVSDKEKRRFLLETGQLNQADNPNAAKCSNPDYQFDSAGAVYYSDPSGKWCLPANKFNSILLDRINPYTGDKLNNTVLHSVAGRVQSAKEHNLPDEGVPFQTAISRLTRREANDSARSLAEIAKFEQQATQNGILRPQEYIRHLESPEKWLIEAIKYLNGSEQMIAGLSNEHAYVTLARFANAQFSSDPQLTKSFFTRFFSARN